MPAPEITMEERIANLETAVELLNRLMVGLTKRTLENAKHLDEGIQVLMQLAQAVQEITDIPIRGKV